MSDTTTETNDEPTAATSDTDATNEDPIVLEAPYGLASVGAVPKSAEGEGETDPEDDPELGNGIREISSPSPDPEPADPSRVIDLPQPESARGGTQEFEVQDVAFARGLLTENKRVTLVENPTDADLSGLLTRKQKRARYRQKKYREKQRNKGTDFDPRSDADNPQNTKQQTIQEAYEDLTVAGEDVAAAQLRGLTDTSKQKAFVQSLRDAEVLSQ